ALAIFRVHRGAYLQRLARGHAALGAARLPRNAADHAARADDLVVRLRAADAGQLEPVPHLNALDRLDAHERGGEPGIQAPVAVRVAAEPRGQAVAQHLDDAAQRVAGTARLVDLRDHRGIGARIAAANLRCVDPVAVLRPGQ